MTDPINFATVTGHSYEIDQVGQLYRAFPSTLCSPVQSTCLYRGHGTTTTIDDTDLSEATLAGDISDVVENVVSELGDPAPGNFLALVE
jgi:hypothetical protein